MIDDVRTGHVQRAAEQLVVRENSDSHLLVLRVDCQHSFDELRCYIVTCEVGHGFQALLLDVVHEIGDENIQSCRD